MEQLQKYKETELGEIPEEWKIVRFQELVHNIQSGIWGEDAIDKKNGYPILRSTDISHESKITYETAAIRKVTVEKATDYELKNGDILIVSSSGSPHLIGRSAIFIKPDDRTYLFSNFLIRITPSKSIVAEYLYHLLHSNFYFSALHKIQETTSGLRNLSKSQLFRISLPVASLSEQHKIASILSNIDELIQKTEHSIEQTQKLKKGLMQKLLTKGIGHTKFKDSDLGKLPHEWNICKLVDVSLSIVKGIFDLNPDNYVTKGIPFIRISDITSNTITLSNTKYIREDINKKFPSSELKPGDIILAKVGASAGSTDKVAEIPGYINKCNISQNLIGIKINHDKINSNFLFHLLHRQQTMDKILSGSNTTTFKSIQLNVLRNILIPLPSKEEQRQIASIISSIDNFIQKQKRIKIRSNFLKKGLMQQLLTGKIRVRI